MAEEKRIEIPYILENVLRYCLKDARERMEAGERIQPFSAMAVGEALFMEQHIFDTPEECYADVRHTVENARGALAYGMCYDGYVDTSEGQKDALIAQGGVPGDAQGHAIGLLYDLNAEGAPTFHDEPVYIGNCENYMAALAVPEEEAASEDEAEPEGEAAPQDETA